MDDVEINIKVMMNKRWVPHFLGMLKEMQRLGRIGSSRMVRFYSDGDGEFRPKFEWDTDISPAEPAHGDSDSGYCFDAG